MTHRLNRSLDRVLTSRSAKLFSVLLLLVLGLLAGTPQAAQQATTQARGGNSGQVAPGQQSGLPSSSTSVAATLTDHRMSGQEPAGNCSPPAPKTAFAPTDARAYQWTLVSGAAIGDTVSWDFRRPDGSSYFTSNITLTINGNVCFWAFINIAGTPAASLTGTWEARVIYNGTLLTSETFTIRNDTVVLTDHRVTGSTPDNVCSAPPTKTSFAPTDPRVYQWILVSGAVSGDRVRWEFVQPNGSVYASSNTLTLTAGGSRCFWVSIDIAGQPAATLPGTWRVRVIYNDIPLLAAPDTFTIGTTASGPAIEVTPASLDFGNVLTGSRATRSLTVRNVGSVPLTISSVTSSNPQFTLALPTNSFGLVPGGSANLNVNFVPNSAGAKTGTLSFNSNDLARPRVDVSMTGTGAAPMIEVTPPSLAFGDLRLAQTRDLSFTIRNTGSAPLKISSLASNNPQFRPIQFLEKVSNIERSLPLNIAPGSNVEVTVRFRPSYLANSVAAQNGVISIVSNDPSRPRVDVPLTGTGLGPLIAAPSSRFFGSVEICSPPVTSTITLTNTGNASLAIAALSIDNPAFMLAPRPSTPFAIAPGASFNLSVSFFTRATVTETGRLRIISNAVNDPGLSILLTGQGLSVAQPAIGQLTVSRTTLSHGRADNARPVTPFNPLGLADVIGFVFPGARLPVNSISPGALTLPLIGGFLSIPAAIPSAADPLRITLAGGVSNPIVLSAANIPGCFTLVVAEGVTAPDLTRWERIGARFGAGNLYASVSIPGTGIFAGMELVTEADLNAYTANSIIYEAPDFGLLVAPAGQNGGTATLQARARRIPADAQCQQAFSQPVSTQVEFSRTVRIEIDPNATVITRTGGGLDLTVTAQIFGNFDPAINTVLRWAYDGETFDAIIDADDMSPPGGPRIVRETFHLPSGDECKLGQITVVASSTGNVPAVFLPPINPFLFVAPDSIGLFTFRSGGCTVEDTKSVLVRLPDSNCGGGAPVGWIRGTVTNAVTGEPIAGATVTVTGTNISAITGANGTYGLNSVPAGQQTLNASAAGFSTRQQQVNVLVGQLTTEDISLTPLTGTLQGYVINAFDNQPIAGAAVSVKGTNLTAISGSDGSYRISNIPAGPQTVDAARSTFNPDQAVVNIIGDQTITEDFFLTPTVGTVSGIVRNAATNQPIPGATVMAAGISATSGGNGSFTLSNIPAGVQTVSATAAGFNPASASVTVIAGANVTQDIAMTPLLGTITGTITNADNGDPIAGAAITVVETGLSTTSGSDGSFIVVNVPAGVQTLNVTASGFIAAQAAGVNVVGNGTVSQNVALSPETGTVRGRITNASTNQPIANAEVELLPFPLTFANSDAAGNYTMTGVPTGQRVVLASAPGYYAKIALVNVVANQTSTQDFALTPQLGSVLGKVFDKLNSTVVGATVTVAGTNISSTTGGDGDYQLDNVPVGTRTLSVSAQGLSSAQVTVIVVANENTYKDIYLETPTGNLRGTVRNASNNQPIAGAQILIGIPFGAVYYSAITDGSGNYLITNMPARSFTVYAGADGFQPSQASISVIANQSTTLDFALTPDAPATGTITGTVRNASNADPIVGATVTVVGTNLSTTSGAGGSYTLSNVPAGAQNVSASATGFSPSQVGVTVVGGQTVTQNISLSPTLPPGEIRITLNWTKDGAGHPNDLDAHLIGPNPDGSCFHVYYGNTGNLGAAPFAKLEVDNIEVTGDPPIETVRISKLSPGIYRFYVNNFSEEDPDGLSRSRATVQIFGASGQMGSFTVPSGAGANWIVFSINGQTGAVTSINQLASPPNGCQ